MRSEKGASSVLVLLLLLMLVLIGVLSFVSAGSGLRLSEKYAASVKAWYRMDLEGERLLSEMAQSIRLSHAESEAWMAGNRFLDEAQEEIPSTISAAWRETWSGLADETARKAFKKEMMPHVFRFFAVHHMQSIESIEMNLPRTWTMVDGRRDLSEVATFLFIIRDPEKESPARLEVKTVLLEYEPELDSGYLRVLQWQQVQEPFQYENRIKLWEGIVE